MLPEAKTYIEKRERKQILDEQLGSPSQRQRNVEKRREAEAIELKEITSKVNKDINSNTSHDNLLTDNDGYDGLGSLTNYSAMVDPLIEDGFIDEANNTVPYTKQRRGYG